MRFFLEELNFLGDSLETGTGIYMALPWWSGVHLGLFAVLDGILCSLYQSAHLNETLCVILEVPISLSSTDPVLGRILFFFP